MMAQIIPFPADRIVRPMETKAALDILDQCEEYAKLDDPEAWTAISPLTVLCVQVLRRRGIPDHLIDRFIKVN